MSDITASYAEMKSGAQKLNQGKASIEEQLGSLKRMVDQLVQTSFKTQKASPKFQQSYEQWDKGAKQAVEGLEGMSQFLDKAVQGMQELDSNLSSGL
jgi:WXG100 family type VII secretion target